MNFDLNQLLQGPVRDLVLEQIMKKLGVSSETGGNLLTKGLSLIVGGMVSKTDNKEGLSHLFDLVKGTTFSKELNPLDILVGKGNQNDENNLLDLGKTLLSRIFSTNTEMVTNHLAKTTNTSSETAKSLLAMLLPIVFSFLKGKIATGVGLSGFAGILAGIGKLVAPYLDNGALKTLGFKGSFNDTLNTVTKLAAPPAAAVQTTKTITSSAVKTEKKSGMGKFILPAVLLLAALLGYKSCSNNADKTTTTTPAAATTVKTVDGLGNLNWNKTDKDLTISGTVQNEETKANILNGFKGLAAGLPLVDKLVVDPKTDKFAFSDFAGLANLFTKFPNVNGAFSDKNFSLTGSVENDADKAGLLNNIKGFLGDKFSINTDALKVAAPEMPTSQPVEGLGNLSWKKTNTDFTVSGTVPNEQTKANILNGFKGLASGLPLVDNLTIDPKMGNFAFGDFAGLGNLFEKFPNVNGTFAGNLFNLSGSVANDSEKASLLDNLKGFFGDKFSINADNLKIATPEVSTQANVEIPAVEGLGNLSWNKTNTDLTVSGTVPNEQTKANILNGFKGLASGLPLVDNLTIDPKIGNFAFNDFAGLSNLFAKFPNVNGAFMDKVFNLTGSVANDAEKASLLDSLKAFFGDKFSINADNLNVAAPTENTQAVDIPTVDGLGDLNWNKTDKGLTLSGTVQNDGIKTNILDGFKGLTTDSSLVDQIKVDPKMPKFAFNNFADLANVFSGFPSVVGAFKDNVLNLAGEVESNEAKAALINNVKAVLGDKFTINADDVQVVAPEEEIKDMSAANLDLQIIFATGSSDISPRYFRRLDALAKYFIENNRRGEIAGYTDNVGSAESNKRLSEVRANAVRNYLIAKGVPAEALIAVGYGQDNPVADNNTVEGRNKNRRIEFKMAQ